MAPSQVAATQAAENGSKTKVEKASYWSLPKKGQLAILCLARIADPLAISSIQSYMFYQLRFFDPNASDATISTQAGILVAARTAAQVLTGMLWGRLADSELGGRKLVLFIGLTSCAISYVGYGLATSFVAAILWQVFAGIMSNNVAITRCVVAELNPEKRYRTRALLLLPLCASTAQLLGPLIGGLLSDNSRGASKAKFPYLWPNLLLAVLYAIAALAVLLFMEETLESRRGTDKHYGQRLVQHLKHRFSRRPSPSTHQEPNDIESAPLLDDEPQPKPNRTKLPFRKIWTFNVLSTLLSHFIISGHLGTFSALWSLFLMAPVQHHPRTPPFVFSGGLGMVPRDVGFALSILGAIGIVLQTVVYPTLQDRFGTIKVWRSALFLFPFTYLVAPYPALVASAAGFKGQTAAVWLSMTAVLLLYTLGRTGVTPATTLLINDCTPHPSVRGTIHAAATTLGHLSRSIFPVAALTVFGQGLNIGVVGLSFWCVALLAVLSCVVSGWVVEGSNGEDIVVQTQNGETRVEAGGAGAGSKARLSS